VEGGWKLKPLHRLMVLSTAYRQSSRNDASLKSDPDNKLFGRFKLQRLGAEALRDSMLAAAGTLNRTAFGPPVSIARDPGGRVVVGQEQHNENGDVIKVASLGENDFRRSIYVQVRRTTPLTVLDTFDSPVMLPNCDSRNYTTVTPQSLLLMNDTFVLSTARTLAARLRKELPGDARGQIVRAWQLLFGQEPQDNDVLRNLSYLTEQTETVRAWQQGQPPLKDTPPPDPSLDALASLCQILYSSNRFLYVE